jgi:hypothetical protein
MITRNPGIYKMGLGPHSDTGWPKPPERDQLLYDSEYTAVRLKETNSHPTWTLIVTLPSELYNQGQGTSLWARTNIYLEPHKAAPYAMFLSIRI